MLESTRADPSLRAAPALSWRASLEQTKQILRFAQDDREESEGMTEMEGAKG
jgi:hypothetical protein